MGAFKVSGEESPIILPETGANCLKCTPVYLEKRVCYEIKANCCYFDFDTNQDLIEFNVILTSIFHRRKRILLLPGKYPLLKLI